MSRHRGAKHLPSIWTLGQVSACYPRRTFYPLSDGPSTRDHRITMADFRLCSTCQSRSQAGFCHCTQQLISDQPEPNLRAPPLLFGRRPPQSNYPPCRVPDPDNGPRLDIKSAKGWYLKVGSTGLAPQASKPPTYPAHVTILMPLQSCSKGARGLSV